MKTLPGWQTLRLTFEAMGLAFSDEWYCTRLIGLGCDPLDGEGEQQVSGLVQFGFYFRDWSARRSLTESESKT